LAGCQIGRLAGSSVGVRPTPHFLVSVASKGFRLAVSLFFATLGRKSASVASKGFTDAFCWQESNWMRCDDLEGVRSTARRESMKGGAREDSADATDELYHIGTYCQVIITSGLSASGCGKQPEERC
jgi:hypothetical protein